MPIELYHSGNSADIFVYVNARGDAPAADFIDGLIQSDQKKIVRLIGYFGDHGSIHNREKFVCEENPIYAFKSFQVRIPAFILPGCRKKTLVLTHGFIKKKDDMPPSELKRAKDTYKEVISTLK